jgi:hypothetical protein
MITSKTHLQTERAYSQIWHLGTVYDMSAQKAAQLRAIARHFFYSSSRNALHVNGWRLSPVRGQITAQVLQLEWNFYSHGSIVRQ